MKKFLIFLIIIFIFACGSKKPIKEPSKEYLYSTEVFKFIDEIRLSYQNKDNEGLRKYFSESAYKELIASIKPFDKAELEFTPVLVEMDGENTRLYVSWNGKWSYLGKDYEERGLASFIIRGNPPKVERIIRGNPFRFPE